MERIFKLLRDYDLTEILEHSDISDEEVLEALVLQGYEINIPEPLNDGNFE